MPSIIGWYIKKGANNYLLDNSNQKIIYRTNKYNEALVSLDITKPTDVARGVFGSEDEVEVWIGDPGAGGTKMLTGYIVDRDDGHSRGGKIEEPLQIIDFGGYRAGKTVFEKRYWKLSTSTAKQIMLDAAGKISGLSANLVSLGGQVDDNLTAQVKNEFVGTYVKDGWAWAASAGKGDYFVDEAKALFAFVHGSRDLIHAGSGIRYKIVDRAVAAANEIKVDSNFRYSFNLNAMQKFRTVIATNAQAFTYPEDINSWCTENDFISGLGKHYSRWFTVLNNDPPSWNPNQLVADGLSKDLEPFDFTQQLEIGTPPDTERFPIIQLNVRKSTDDISFLIAKLSYNNPITYENLGIDLSTWQEISFFMREQLTPTPTDINIVLNDFSGVPGAFASRKIKQGATNLLLAGGMTWLRFALPTSSIDNGWTVSNPRPTKIDVISFDTSPLSGYTGTIKFSQPYLYKRTRKQSATAAGTPATTKIIVNRSITSDAVLQTMANNEYDRVNTDAKIARFTTKGDVVFRKPGYNIDVDFTSTLGAGRSATQLRMDEVIHSLEKSRHRMVILLKPAFQRL